MQYDVLILDDEPDIRELLELTLSRMGVSHHSDATLSAAIDSLNHHNFRLCLTDIRLPDGSGIDLVRHIQNNIPNLPVAVITAFGNTDVAVDSFKAGAFDFINKPIDLMRLRTLIESALKLSDNAHPDSEDNYQLIGSSPAADHIRTLISKLARSQAPVLITGESGTGKELAARLIHEKSPRNSHPFIAVNCGAIPSELMESEFFGHTKGSFTGASADRQGLFHAADKGTLFLDEISELSHDMQVKLLRAIQERTVRRVGDYTEENVDCRILSASNKDLKLLMQSDQFRNDLYYRINVIELNLPPLRMRREDIPILARHILNRNFATAHGPAPELDEKAMERLYPYDFPGNIRELENILERATALSEGRTLTVDDLDFAAPMESRPGNTSLSRNSQPLQDYLAEIEKNEIMSSLESRRWNQAETANDLGLSLRQLRYKMKKLNIV